LFGDIILTIGEVRCRTSEGDGDIAVYIAQVRIDAVDRDFVATLVIRDIEAAENTGITLALKGGSMSGILR
jgi:hypothetical protein